MLDHVESLNISDFVIKVGGQELDSALKEHILELVVDSHRHLPDMFTLQIFDNDFGQDAALIDGTTFDLGKAIEVTVNEQPLFKGEVTAIEPEFTDAGMVLFSVRGYDKSHRLHRGRKSRAFANMKDSDIVSKIAQEVGLTSNTETTPTTYEHVWQKNQTDMDFIRERARRLGFHVYVDGDKLYFKKAGPENGHPIELTWGLGLMRFRPKMKATHQVDEVVVRSWDPSTKQKVEAKSTSASSTQHQGGVTKDGGAAAKQAFVSANTMVVSYPYITSGEATKIAQALYDRIAGSFVEAEGVCFGNPRVKAGEVVKVVGVGERFSGTYAVTSATHVFTTEQGYETTFHIQGPHSDVLTYLLEGEQQEDVHRGLVTGVVTGVVTNIDDKDNLGRVKVKYPWLDEQLESHWARVAAPSAGAQRGFLTLPEVNDEVLVAFEHGDINAPYIIGGLWNNQDKLPKGTGEVVQNAKVTQRIFRSRTGHLIVLDDTEGSEQIVIRDKTGKNEIIIDSKGNNITINLDNDYTLAAKNKISSTSQGATDIVSKGAMSIKADGGSNITIQSTGSATVKSQQNLTLEATGQLVIKGATVSVEAQSQAQLKGNAMVQIQGGVVKIN